MGEKVHVTKREHCPICDGDKWCFWFPANSLVPGAKLIACRGEAYVAGIDTMKNGDVLRGADGKNYVFCSRTRGDDIPFFEEQEQREQNARLRKEEWKANRGKEVSVQRVQQKKETPKHLLTHTELDRVYRAMLEAMILEAPHRQSLNRDGWSDELIEKNLIRSFPLDDYTRFEQKKANIVGGRQMDVSRNIWRHRLVEVAQQALGRKDLSGVPGFYYAGDKWKLAGMSGIVFPTYDARHLIYRLEIRMDKPINGGGKYNPLSSNPEKLTKNGKQMYPKGTSSGASASLIYYPNDTAYVAYITEGKKKAIIGNALSKAPFIALPGVGNFGMLTSEIDDISHVSIAEYLRNIGTQIVVVAFDADSETNPQVMKCQNKMIQLLKEEGFKVGLASWDVSIAKGLDDLMVRGLRPSLQYV